MTKFSGCLEEPSRAAGAVRRPLIVVRLQIWCGSENTSKIVGNTKCICFWQRNHRQEDGGRICVASQFLEVWNHEFMWCRNKRASKQKILGIFVCTHTCNLTCWLWCQIDCINLYKLVLISTQANETETWLSRYCGSALSYIRPFVPLTDL